MSPEDPTHGNSVLIKPGHVLGDFPAPLRIEFTNSSVNNWGRIIMGAYHHPTMNSEDPFFCMANDMTGGTQFANAAAINGYYRTFTFTTATFASFSPVLWVMPSQPPTLTAWMDALTARS